MTATQLPLFPPGWQEECGDPDERAFVVSQAPPELDRDTEDVPTGRYL